jgi:soluble lytic murein transglycosylase-like protein
VRAPFRPRRGEGGARDARAAHRLLFLLLSGLSVAAAQASPSFAQPAPPAHAEADAPFATFVAEASQRFGIPVAWIRAVMRVESANDVRAVSSKGAMGLMQIMPDTWSKLRARHRLGDDPFNPRDNILAGAAYLRELYDKYGSPGFLSAYNAGPGRYEEYLAGGRALPAETRTYTAQLAPLVGRQTSASFVTVAVADALAWTRAPLFVGATARSSAAVPAPQEVRSNDAEVAVRPRDVIADATSTGGLFITRREPAGPQ